MQTSQNTQKAAHKNSTPGAGLLVIQREFHVPVKRLFGAFSSAEALKAWWWPKGLYADHIDFDFRAGGHYFINMKGYDQGGGGMTGDIEEIVPNKRIVMSDNFADQNGRAISAAEAQMPGNWPEKIYITFDFEELSGHASRFVLSQEGIPDEMQSDCVQGWSESFDKLEEYLGVRKQ